MTYNYIVHNSKSGFKKTFLNSTSQTIQCNNSNHYKEKEIFAKIRITRSYFMASEVQFYNVINSYCIKIYSLY